MNNTYQFNAAHATEKCAAWVKKWFDKNGPDCKAVIGISGGKDSSVAAAILVKALGKDRVFGVLMPQGRQTDIEDSEQLVRHLGIESITVNIGETCNALQHAIQPQLDYKWSDQTNTNMPPRIRMTTLYAVSQTVNGRVCNTCNYSEDYIGYSTRYGDSVGDFSPLSGFTVEEVKLIGRYLELPINLIDKTPADGLCGKTDEDNLGFTYQMLDDYLRRKIQPPADIKAKIDAMHKKNLFKLRLMPAFTYLG